MQRPATWLYLAMALEIIEKRGACGRKRSPEPLKSSTAANAGAH